jgi:hypothetical protein
MASDRRFWLFEYLLSRHLPTKVISSVLLETLKAEDGENKSLLKLLLDHGASVDSHEAQVFRLAIKTKSANVIGLFSQYIKQDSTPAVVFDFVRGIPSLDDNIRMEVYRHMLPRKLDKSSIYHALVEHLESGRRHIAILRLLLKYGADPNTDGGYCFVVVSKAKAEPEFQALSKRANLSVVMRALLESYLEEEQILHWATVCQRKLPNAPILNDNKLLFLSIKKFPSAIKLLKLLLKLGACASTTINYNILAGHQEEMCTLLIWALLQSPAVENNVILTLLESAKLTGMPPSFAKCFFLPLHADRCCSSTNVFNTGNQSHCRIALHVGPRTDANLGDAFAAGPRSNTRAPYSRTDVHRFGSVSEYVPFS